MLLLKYSQTGSGSSLMEQPAFYESVAAMAWARRWRGCVDGVGVMAHGYARRQSEWRVDGVSMYASQARGRSDRDAEKRTGRGPLGRRVRQLEGLLALEVAQALDLQNAAREDVLLALLLYC